MRKLEIAFIAALFICVLAAAKQIPFSLACEEVRDDTLRLHIIANSDSDDDQQVKLLVRDAVLSSSGAFTEKASGKAGLVSDISDSLDEIERTANKVLAENGFSYTARAEITDMYFDQRNYDTLTLPAGRYTALRVTLGEAKGKNWWCVIYPSICLEAASARALEEYSEAEAELVKGYPKYEFRFKIEEWLQSLRARRNA